MAFRTEKEMTDFILSSSYISNLLKMDSCKTYYELEPQGLFGIPDLVIANIHERVDDVEFVTFAFEFKLSNWKRALMQAYRYKSFANFAYVMLDSDHASPALSNIEHFKKANIGLLSVDMDKNIFVHYEPNFDDPYSEQLQNIIKEKILESVDALL